MSGDLPYHRRLPLWPDVDIVGVDMDGLLPACRLKSWRNFDQIVDQLSQDGTLANYVFRGHHHYRWQLEPTLDRTVEGAIRADVAGEHLQRFRLSLRGRVPNDALLHSDDDDELWAVGQHHGLMTPLLDWTSSPYVALFFAFADVDKPEWTASDDSLGEASSRAVILLDRQFILDLDSDNGDYPRIVEPSSDNHGRLVSQAGMFTFAPYGESLESSLIRALNESGVNADDPKELAKYILKVHIPNDPRARRECLSRLQAMNVHQASLFPDVIGSALYCNRLTEESPRLQPRTPPADPVRARMGTGTARAEGTPVNVVVAEPSTNIIDAIKQVSPDHGGLAEAELMALIRKLRQFVDNEAGVDWYDRGSEMARLRTWFRRQLLRAGFTPDLAHEATRSAIAAIADQARAAN